VSRCNRAADAATGPCEQGVPALTCTSKGHLNIVHPRFPVPQPPKPNTQAYVQTHLQLVLLVRVRVVAVERLLVAHLQTAGSAESDRLTKPCRATSGTCSVRSTAVWERRQAVRLVDVECLEQPHLELLMRLPDRLPVRLFAPVVAVAPVQGIVASAVLARPSA